MAKKFKNGDVVYLKSGSDPMTVKAYDTIPDGRGNFKESEENLTCCWQVVKNKEMQCMSFNQDMLTTDNPQKDAGGIFLG